MAEVAAVVAAAATAAAEVVVTRPVEEAAVAITVNRDCAVELLVV